MLNLLHHKLLDKLTLYFVILNFYIFGLFNFIILYLILVVDAKYKFIFFVFAILFIYFCFNTYIFTFVIISYDAMSTDEIREKSNIR